MKLRINLSKPTEKKIMTGDKLSLDKEIYYPIVGLGWNGKQQITQITIDNEVGEIFK